MKPVLSGHPRDLAWYPLNRECPLNRVYIDYAIIVNDEHSIVSHFNEILNQALFNKELCLNSSSRINIVFNVLT